MKLTMIVPSHKEKVKIYGKSYTFKRLGKLTLYFINIITKVLSKCLKLIEK